RPAITSTSTRSCSRASASTSCCAAARSRPAPPSAISSSGPSSRHSGGTLDRGRPACACTALPVEDDREDFFDRVDGNELQRTAGLRGQLVEIGLVLAREDDALQPCALSGECLPAQ